MNESRTPQSVRSKAQRLRDAIKRQRGVTMLGHRGDGIEVDCDELEALLNVIDVAQGIYDTIPPAYPEGDYGVLHERLGRALGAIHKGKSALESEQRCDAPKAGSDG